MSTSASRRRFLQGSASAAGLALIPYTWTSAQEQQAAPKSPNERWRIGTIGLRYQGSVITRESLPFGDVVALCDVDRHVLDQARASFGSTAQIYGNYNDLLARKDIDVVLIGTPDHWHTKMVIDACRAGKDVYCEKPLTLTVDEGKRLCAVVKETGRVVQTGSWQRSDARFRQAVEMVRAGRIGKLQRVTVVMGKNTVGGPFTPQPVPKHFNWNQWQGPTADVPYIPERSHYTFRWWYEYSGGEMTDTGAHHLDIAQWGIGLQHSGPVEIAGTAKYPAVENGFNVAIDYHTLYKYANGVELEVLDSPRGEHTRNGVMFEGEGGRLFVNRGVISGRPVEELAKKPFSRLPRRFPGLPPRQPRPARTQRQDRCHQEPHGQLLRLHAIAEAAHLRRLHPAPLGHPVPPGQHRPAPGPKAGLGPRGRTVCRLPGSQPAPEPPSTPRIRDQLNAAILPPFTTGGRGGYGKKPLDSDSTTRKCFSHYKQLPATPGFAGRLHRASFNHSDNAMNLCTTDWSSLTPQQQIGHLELEGFVVLPDVLTADQVARIKTEVARLPTKGTDYSENQRGYSDVQWTDSPACIDIIAQPAILSFLSRLFGDDLICTSCVYALSRPGHPGIALHTDSQPYGSAIFGMQASAPRLVRVLHYLDDLTPQRSPFKVIPRSHLSLHADANPYKRYLSHPEEVMVTCRAGSAAIINQAVFHANYPNTSQEDRGLLAIAYRPAWAGPIADVQDWPAEKVAQLPPQVQPLFGSLNTRKIDYNVGNRPPNMANGAPGINPSRWS